MRIRGGSGVFADLGEIRRHALGVVELTLRRVAINVVSERRAEVFADVPGFVTVDVSENLSIGSVW